MELIFLLIFIVFIFLNIILGFVAARAKKKRMRAAALQEKAASPEPAEPLPEQAPVFSEKGTGIQEAAVLPLQKTAEQEMPKHREPFRQAVPLLQPQTVAALFKPEYTITEEAADTTAEEAVSDAGVKYIDTGGTPAESEETYEKPGIILGEAGFSSTEMPSDHPLYTAGPDAAYAGAGPGAWERLQKLPPLQKAVIFSEILGRPKGLSSG